MDRIVGSKAGTPVLKEWFISGLRKLLSRKEFREDDEWIGSNLVPPISGTEACNARKALTAKGLLMRDETGKLRFANKSPDEEITAPCPAHPKCMENPMES